ncbi:MAG: hypothetical protein ACKVI8_06930 [Paraglaciecola sp.]
MTKPIHINGLTQEQRNTCVAAAIQSGSKLNDWAAEILVSTAEKQLCIKSLVKYINDSENQGYEQVLIDIDKAKKILSWAANAQDKPK